MVVSLVILIIIIFVHVCNRSNGNGMKMGKATKAPRQLGLLVPYNNG